MIDYGSLPGGDTAQFAHLWDYLNSGAGFRQRLAIKDYANTLEFEEDRGFTESTGEFLDRPQAREGKQAFIRLLQEHPAIRDEDPAVFPIGWLTEQIELSSPEGLFLATSFDLLFTGIMALVDVDWQPELVDVLIRVAFGVDAVDILLREAGLGRSLPVFPELPELLGNWEELYRMTCSLGVRHAMNEFGQAAQNRPSEWKVAAISDISPNEGCEGDIVTINGTHFGSSQPPDVQVIFPAYSGACVNAQVIKWSDTAVQVQLPTGVGFGCAGYMRKPSEGGTSIVEAADSLAGEMEACFGMVASQAAYKLRQIATSLGDACPQCLPGGENHFAGGPPKIEVFQANHGQNATLRPGDTLELYWTVTNATSVTITKSATPELPAITALLNPGSGSIQFPVPATGSWQGAYELVADNACGAVQALASIIMIGKVALVLAGGGSRGAFEVGAVRCLYDRFGVTPDIITGTSVGALNGSKLAEGPGSLGQLEQIWLSLQFNADMYTPQAWFTTLKRKTQFLWEASANSFAESLGAAGIKFGTSVLISQFVSKGIGALIPYAGLVYDFLFTLPQLIMVGIDIGVIADAAIKAAAADSVYNSMPIKLKIDASIDPAKIAASKIIFRAAVVNLESGLLRYVTEQGRFLDNNAQVPLRDAILASGSIPIAFPPVKLLGENYIDGGTRENIPVAAAVNAGANFAYIIMAGSVGIPPETTYNGATLSKIAPRVMNIVLDEGQTDDIAPYRGFGIPTTLIAPRLLVHGVLFIDPGLISINMDYGYMRAFDEVQSNAGIRPALRDSSDTITEARAEIWTAEHYPNGEFLPGEDRSGLRHVPYPDELQYVRDLKKNLRIMVYDRLNIGGIGCLPNNAAAWWQRWERHNWQPSISSPWDMLITKVGNLASEAVPPA
jgi:NTE family protein